MRPELEKKVERAIRLIKMTVGGGAGRSLLFRGKG